MKDFFFPRGGEHGEGREAGGGGRGRGCRREGGLAHVESTRVVYCVVRKHRGVFFAWKSVTELQGKSRTDCRSFRV